MQNNNLMYQLQALRQNPMQFLMQRRFNVPQNIANNPNAIIQHLMNTGQISQAQYNQAAQMAKQFQQHVYSKYKVEYSIYIGHRKTNPDAPAPTITARGDSKGGVVVLPHYNGKRRMTCRELATIQTFPLNFTFFGTNTSVYRQIGNAVPVRLAYCIAKQFNLYK